MPLQELDPNILSLKKSKGRCKESKPSNKENKVDGGVAVMRWLRVSIVKPNERTSVELSGSGVISSSSFTHRGGEIKEPYLGVPC